MLFGVSAFFFGIAIGAVLVKPTFTMSPVMLPQRINDSRLLHRANDAPGELIIDAEFDRPDVVSCRKAYDLDAGWRRDHDMWMIE